MPATTTVPPPVPLASRSVLGLGSGALAALALALTGFQPLQSNLAPVGAIWLWAGDRDGHGLYGLDEQLLLARRAQIGWPLEVEEQRGGGVFVLRSGNAGSAFGHRLDVVDAEGNVTSETYLNYSHDLSTNDGREALVIENGSSWVADRRLVKINHDGGLTQLYCAPALACVQGSRGSVLVGTEDGFVMRLALSGPGAPLDRVHLGGSIGDLAAGPDPGSVFALDVHAPERLLYLAADLSVRWSVTLQLAARHIASIPGEERVWLADTVQSLVRRYGPNGGLELERTNLPALALDRTLPWIDGGVLISSPGAIVHLDANGNLAPGQGGFSWLSDFAY